MSRKYQQNREKVHLFAFIESIKNFTEGEIINDERPDFLIKNGQHITGIELTELFHEPRKDGTILQARENYILKILNEATKLYNNLHCNTVNVHAIFSVYAKLGKSKVDRLAEQLVDVVKKNIPTENKAHKTIRRVSTDNILPSELSMVKVVRLDDIEESKFYPTGIGGFQRFQLN